MVKKPIVLLTWSPGKHCGLDDGRNTESVRRSSSKSSTGRATFSMSSCEVTSLIISVTAILKKTSHQYCEQGTKVILTT